jgi:hypothetical protein
VTRGSLRFHRATSPPGWNAPNFRPARSTSNWPVGCHASERDRRGVRMSKMLRFPSIAGVIVLTPQEWQSSCHRCQPVGANPSTLLLAPDRGRQILQTCRPLRGLANHAAPIPPVRTPRLSSPKSGGKQTVAAQRGSTQARELERTERFQSGDSSRIRRPAKSRP